MKRILLISLALFFIQAKSFAQDNLIPNPGFENGSSSPSCDYEPLTSLFINADIYDWDPNSNVKIHHKHSYPQWCGYSTPPYSGNNSYIHMHEAQIGSTNKPNEQDDIWTSLTSSLRPNTFYTFRVQLSTDYTPYGAITYYSNNNNAFNVYFSKFGPHWYRNWGNARLEFNSAITIPISTSSGYQTYEFTFFTIPSIAWSELTNIVLSVSSGGLDVDNVELFEECPDNLFIQNKNYYFYDYPYHAAQNITAGYNVGGPGSPGNVGVHPGATITYTAGNMVDLKPGFFADNGSVFTANIAPCPALRVEDPTTVSHRLTTT